MKLYLSGHDYKYAVEQMLLTLLPGERPEYPEDCPSDGSMEITLCEAGGMLEAGCIYRRDGVSFTGSDRRAADESASPLERERVEQRLVKNAMYRAILSSGIRKPEWGALTGVRPGKLLCGLLKSTCDREEAVKRFTEDYDVSPVRAQLCLDTAEYTLGLEESLGEKDICLYLGVPFCPTRCAYCSFVSQSVEKSMALIEPFTGALLKEIKATAEAVNSLGLRPVSIYMGGGTPTTLSAEQLERVCSELERNFDLSAVKEYTVEAGRPDTITEEKLTVLRKHGVDRISVNPQTMSDSVLEAIGRKHTAADIYSALELVRKVGGFSVNMDLIAGLPSDSTEGFRETLEKVIALSPENITVHTLSLKKGSRIMLENSEIPDGESVSDMLDISRQLLAQADYRPYYLYRQKFMSGGGENTGWTRPGFENIYNICIMEELCSIVAMGGGGSTKLIRPGDGRNIRIMEPKYPKEYIEMIDKTCEDKKKIIRFYTQEETDNGISAQ